MVRLEIVDDLLPLIDGLDAFSKRASKTLSWSTSGGQVRLDLRWNSSLDIRCEVKVGTFPIAEDSDSVLSREDTRERYEVVFVVVLPRIDTFLDGLREVASFYPQYPPES